MPLVRGILLNSNRASTLFNVNIDENHLALSLIIIIVICITRYLLIRVHPLILSGKMPGSVSKYKAINVFAAVHASYL